MLQVDDGRLLVPAPVPFPVCQHSQHWRHAPAASLCAALLVRHTLVEWLDIRDGCNSVPARLQLTLPAADLAACPVRSMHVGLECRACCHHHRCQWCKLSRKWCSGHELTGCACIVVAVMRRAAPCYVTLQIASAGTCCTAAVHSGTHALYRRLLLKVATAAGQAQLLLVAYANSLNLNNEAQLQQAAQKLMHTNIDSLRRMYVWGALKHGRIY
jgi:hypothetical protein